MEIDLRLCAAIVALAICAAPAAPAWAERAPTSAIPFPTSAIPFVKLPTSATIAPSLAPNRLGAKGAVTVAISYTGGEFGVPSAVRKVVLRLPAGLEIDIPHPRVCTAARLRSRGAHGCPSQSQIGAGSTRTKVLAGSVYLNENVTLRAFLGPLTPTGQSTLAILGQGYTPLGERMVLPGTVLFESAPYGEALSIQVPPIPTLPFGPFASPVTFSLTLGAPPPHRKRDANTVIVPSICPPGGFPFAAEFTYADGSTGSAHAAVPCPPARR